MFIRIEDNIINISEIRNVELNAIGYGKGVVKIFFRNGKDDLLFTSRPLAECRSIMDILTEACVGKNN
jgi:hypothetical protein